MLQNTSKTLGFQKTMVYKTPPGGGGKPYLARGLHENKSIRLQLFLLSKINFKGDMSIKENKTIES